MLASLKFQSGPFFFIGWLISGEGLELELCLLEALVGWIFKVCGVLDNNRFADGASSCYVGERSMRQNLRSLKSLFYLFTTS